MPSTTSILECLYAKISNVMEKPKNTNDIFDGWLIQRHVPCRISWSFYDYAYMQNFKRQWRVETRHRRQHLSAVKNRKLCGSALAENGKLFGHLRHMCGGFNGIVWKLYGKLLWEKLLARVSDNFTQRRVFTWGWTIQVTIHDLKIINKRLKRWRQITSNGDYK
jgi:hypothetical protein